MGDETILISLMHQILERLDDINTKQDSTAIEMDKIKLMLENSNLRQQQTNDNHDRRICDLEADVADLKRVVNAYE
jgi:polyhydroxyalkanoate synthesis regulator phasin